MSKNGKYCTPKKRGFGRFLLGMVIYAIVFLGLTAVGLKYFWQFMEGFENSRPQNTVNAYMQALTAEHICDLSGNVIDSIDHNLQSEESCREYLLSNLSDDFSCAKKSADCTDDYQLYMIRCGKTLIGKFSIVTGEADRYGFKSWKVQEESFDLSYLVGESASITVPDQLSVVVNGKKLDSSYITEDQIPYPELEDYYDSYSLPHRVTYTFGPFLGEYDTSVQNDDGDVVTLDENTDYSVYFHNCSEEESQLLDARVKKFLERYIAFTGSANRARMDNYNLLMMYVVPESDLANRMLNAIDGLYYAQSKGDKLATIDTHHRVRLEEGRYLYDVTYEVDTTGYQGVVRTQTNAKIILVEQNSNLLIESFLIY